MIGRSTTGDELENLREIVLQGRTLGVVVDAHAFPKRERVVVGTLSIESVNP